MTVEIIAQRPRYQVSQYTAPRCMFGKITSMHVLQPAEVKNLFVSTSYALETRAEGECSHNFSQFPYTSKAVSWTILVYLTERRIQFFIFLID